LAPPWRGFGLYSNCARQGKKQFQATGSSFLVVRHDAAADNFLGRDIVVIREHTDIVAIIGACLEFVIFLAETQVSVRRAVFRLRRPGRLFFWVYGVAVSA